jgi:hypothetical protein
MKRLVKITKIKAREDACSRTPDWKEYELGKINGNMSIPIDYYLEGYLKREVQVGLPVVVDRITRNGEKVSGLFVTSTVTEITEKGFRTLNSEYIMDYIM